MLTFGFVFFFEYVCEINTDKIYQKRNWVKIVFFLNGKKI